jgi:hypothetical protein
MRKLSAGDGRSAQTASPRLHAILVPQKIHHRFALAPFMLPLELPGARAVRGSWFWNENIDAVAARKFQVCGKNKFLDQSLLPAETIALLYVGHSGSSGSRRGGLKHKSEG